MTRSRLPRFRYGATILLVGSSVLVAAVPANSQRLSPLTAHVESRPVVRWVFHDADLLSCQTPAYTLRHLRSRFGNTVQLQVIGVDVDQASARAFLRAQRLDVTFVALTAADYRERFATRPVSGLFVLVGHRVLGSYFARSNRGYPSPELVSSRIQASLFPAAQSLTYSTPTLRRKS